MGYTDCTLCPFKTICKVPMNGKNILAREQKEEDCPIWSLVGHEHLKEHGKTPTFYT